MKLQKIVPEFWYGLCPHRHDIVQMREIYLDPYLAGNIWIVRGADRTLVIDTGTGLVPPAPILTGLADRPLLAVACNAWYDHAGGLHYFSNRACHELDQPLISAPTITTSAVSTYVNESMLLGWPAENFKIESYRMQGTQPTQILRDGDILDLGNRQLEIIHVPGMTPGSIALWEAATGSLFTSDTLYDDPLNATREAEQESPVTYDESAHKNSLLRIRDLPVVMVYPGHFACFGRNRMLEIIDEIVESV